MMESTIVEKKNKYSAGVDNRKKKFSAIYRDKFYVSKFVIEKKIARDTLVSKFVAWEKILKNIHFLKAINVSKFVVEFYNVKNINALKGVIKESASLVML